MGDEHQRSVDVSPDARRHLDPEFVRRSQQPHSAEARRGEHALTRECLPGDRMEERREDPARAGRADVDRRRPVHGLGEGERRVVGGCRQLGGLDDERAEALAQLARAALLGRGVGGSGGRGLDAGVLIAQRTGDEQRDPAALRLDAVARGARIIRGEPRVVGSHHGGVRGERKKSCDRLAARAVDAQDGDARIDRPSRMASVLRERRARGDRDAQRGGSQRAGGGGEGGARRIRQRAKHGRVVPAEDAGLSWPVGGVAAGSRVGVGGGDDQSIELEHRRALANRLAQGRRHDQDVEADDSHPRMAPASGDHQRARLDRAELPLMMIERAAFAEARERRTLGDGDSHDGCPRAQRQGAVRVLRGRSAG